MKNNIRPLLARRRDKRRANKHFGSEGASEPESGKKEIRVSVNSLFALWT